MCGILALCGQTWELSAARQGVEIQAHRGPDAQGIWSDPQGRCHLGHDRLSIIDLSDAGRQPMSDASGRWWIVFNGEIYNYVELRRELQDQWEFRTQSDTEVLLAALVLWGPTGLDRLIGMFAFAVWDSVEATLFAARDRFGVKPLYQYSARAGELALSSEIKGLHAVGAPREPDEAAWATYLATGMYDHGPRTFWRSVQAVPAGSWLSWSADSGLKQGTWYDPARSALAKGIDSRDDREVAEELLELLEDSIRLRLRADVPIGICLSGGFDSSLLLSLVRRRLGPRCNLSTFTFITGDPSYDETPWVLPMLEGTEHPAHFCELRAEHVPGLAERVAWYQDEPFGGFPTLAMASVHESARRHGIVVLLDGNGLDEAWAGYDYYSRAEAVDASRGPVQGSRGGSTRSDCLRPEFAALSEEIALSRPFADPLSDLQLRDIRQAKIPRAMRFADRVSMMFSRELREPFLDHRIVELGLRQPRQRKIHDGQGKWLLRQLAHSILPRGVREAPKRAVQTPQREWLTGTLADWARDQINAAMRGPAQGWLDPTRTRLAIEEMLQPTRALENSFPLWQWISIGLILNSRSPGRPIPDSPL